ncbi:MAG: hypothetical protein DI533_13605 [Cereibacter sphaeroides]|uniref:Uncharacterized protein n=1 Tax=Cereibacter sphaeroides TaxID=1063 RepID=A0A2W5U0F3_CERSP|nr:MAG: hypothetical protein DI533_13605 [Cereibacter sphaeroides]
MDGIMLNRITLLRGATALLYLGPLIAGLSTAGWALVPVFSLLFILWLIFLRPESWPGNSPDWRRGRTWLPIASRGVVQILLVTIFFGIGRGIGGVLDFSLEIPFWLPVVLSSSAILLGRAIWNPEEFPQGEPLEAPQEQR